MPALVRTAAILAAAFTLADVAAAQGVPQTDPGKPPADRPAPPSQQHPPQIPPAEREATQKQNLPVIKPPAQVDPHMVKPAPDAGPNSTPVVKPPPNSNDQSVPK